MTDPEQPNASKQTTISTINIFVLDRVWLGVWIAALFMILGFGGRFHWRLELLSHFRIQYTTALTCALALFLLMRSWRRAAITACVMIIPLFSLISDWLPRPQVQPAQAVRLLLSNVRTSNRNSPGLIACVQRENPDIIVLQEVDQRWWDEIAELRNDYPYQIRELRDDNFGIACLSRLALGDYTIERIEGIGVPSICCDIRTHDGLFRLIATHPVPPGKASGAYDRNRQLAKIASWASHESKPVVVLGDLNVTPWSPHFSILLRDANLQDTRVGFGLQTTWPDLPSPFRIPIDHCLISHDIMVDDRRVGPTIDSDHRPIIVDLIIPALQAPFPTRGL